MTATNSKGLRLIQAGVGGHGKYWIESAVASSPDFDVVAIADPSPEARAHAAGVLKLGEDRCFDRVEEAVAAFEADALLSVTPPSVHAAHSKVAADAGLHFLVEKPLAEDLDVAREMVERHEAAGLQLMVGQNRRWDPEPLTLRKAFADEHIGEFGHGHIDFNIPVDFRGSFRQTMKHVLLVDMTVHHVDLLRFILGRDVVRVYAEDFNTSWAEKDGTYEDGAAIKMILTLDDGTRMSYAGDWSARGRPTSWQGAWKLQGSKGRLIFDDDTGVVIQTSTFSGKDLEETPIPMHEPINSKKGLLAAFAESIRTGKPGLTNGRDNLKTLAAVIAAVESCETGLPVEVDRTV